MVMLNDSVVVFQNCIKISGINVLDPLSTKTLKITFQTHVVAEAFLDLKKIIFQREYSY